MNAADFVNDISEDVARRAHYGTSFVPEKRAQQEREGYAETLAHDYAELSKLATTPEKAATLAEEFQRYRDGYRRRYVARLLAASRCMSTMITGPANFPTRQQEKRRNTEHKRLTELVEFRLRALDAIRKTLCPELRPIMAGDADATARLRERISEAEAEHAKIKTRTHYSFELKNSSANIRRMKERLASIERNQSRPTVELDGRDGIKIEDNPAENRVRLFFPGKPAADVRDRLKSSGFRWAPSLGCWQAYRNSRSIDTARTFAVVKQEEKADAPRCGCPVNAPEADAAEHPCPCGEHCQDCQK